MPVFRSDETAPSWCEMRSFDVIYLNPGESRQFTRREPREKLIAGRGGCQVVIGSIAAELPERQIFDLPNGETIFEARAGSEPVTLILMSGTWGDEIGGAGIFGGVEEDNPKDGGDPVSYPKRTKFDSHYHDCDEYWIVFEGRGTAVSEGMHYQVGPGDCLATGMGHHHDLPLVSEPIRSVFFETTLEGQKRRGHLWDHTHGKAQPQAERV
jgi:mannose-6-phosphate isomerase-like protein (cupin superfamily)